MVRSLLMIAAMKNNMSLSIKRLINLSKKFFDFLIFSLLWLAFACIALSIYCADFLNIVWNNQVALFILCSICFGYNLDRLADLKIQRASSEQSKSFYKNTWLLIAITSMTISLFCLLLLFLSSTTLTKAVVIICISVGLLYSLPALPLKISGINRSSIRLKDIPLLKAFIVGITLAFGIVFLPLSCVPQLLPFSNVLIVFYFIFVLMFSGTVTVDLRDIISDREHKVPTIPVLFGAEMTKLFLVVINIASIFIIGFACHAQGIISLKFIPMMLALLFTIVYVVIAGSYKATSNEYFYDLKSIVFYIPLVISKLIYLCPFLVG
jgi:4-hydroxybenzoate polyprenyltransferase